MDTAVSVERQIRDLLRADAGVLDAMRLGSGEEAEDDATVLARIVDQPLKRATDDDPDLWANDPTPQCFEAVSPHWLLPSVSVAGGQPLTGASHPAQARYLAVRFTVAYYAGPDVSSVRLWQMRSACMRALDRETVTFPDGMGAKLMPINDLSAIVPVPEFPGAGDVMLERIGAYGVWRRS